MGRTKLNIITDKRVAYSKALLMPIKSVDKAKLYSDITQTNAIQWFTVQVTCTHMNTRDMGIIKHTCGKGFTRTGCCGG